MSRILLALSRRSSYLGTRGNDARRNRGTALHYRCHRFHSAPAADFQPNAESRRREPAVAPDPSRGGPVIVEDRAAFCRKLRDARELRGLTLRAIGESTKISASLLADLERGDLMRWPKGIFRRGFLREYAAEVGLPPDQVLDDFRRLFPDADETTGVIPPLMTHTAESGLRLTLALDHRTWFVPTAMRALSAGIDVLAVIGLAGVCAWLMSASFATAAAGVALLYYGLATACTGTTVASLFLTGRLRFWPRTSSQSAEQPLPLDGPRLVFRRQNLLPNPVAEQSGEEGTIGRSRRAASS